MLIGVLIVLYPNTTKLHLGDLLISRGALSSEDLRRQEAWHKESPSRKRYWWLCSARR